MNLDIVGLVGASSYALDCIEAELVNLSNKHGKRVAYMSATMAKKMNIEGEELQDLVMCALLHDNALNKYLFEEFQKDLTKCLHEKKYSSKIGVHCFYGEEYLRDFPFFTDVQGVILYHHENANGTGPFHKKANETPLFSRIIHICDVIDSVSYSFKKTNEEHWKEIVEYLTKQKGILFDEECVDVFLEACSSDTIALLNSKNLEKELWKLVPRKKIFCDFDVIVRLVTFLGTIIDYKSAFTSKHSLGVAQKAAKLAEDFGYNQLMIEKMYLAGALHDIGKVIVGNDILEKPDKLTDEEYENMKNHAGYTYFILSNIEDFEEERDIAALHHEKLDGTGYPFGKKGNELTQPQKIMACVDIYQALSEDRPYKKGMSHEKTCEILLSMVNKGQLDKEITLRMCELFKENL